MSEAVYFGILKQHGREKPQLFYDEVPRVLRGKDTPLIYCTRLDTLPAGEALTRLRLADLMSIYRGWQAAKSFPPDNRGG